MRLLKTVLLLVGRIATAIDGLLNSCVNRFFKPKSLLRLYREANQGITIDRLCCASARPNIYYYYFIINHTPRVYDRDHTYNRSGEKVMEKIGQACQGYRTMVQMSSITQNSNRGIDREITESDLGTRTSL
jgi:hypothetical protein